MAFLASKDTPTGPVKMEPGEIIKHYLIGQTIKDVIFTHYLHWPMCISEIHLDNGAVIEMTGNADEARIEFVYLKNGAQIVPTEDESKS